MEWNVVDAKPPGNLDGHATYDRLEVLQLHALVFAL